MTWLPDRKVWAGGLAGLVTWGVSLAAQRYLGVTLPPDLVAMIVGGVTTGVAYLVPPSVKDIVKRLNDGIVQMAADDPNIPVTRRP